VCYAGAAADLGVPSLIGRHFTAQEAKTRQFALLSYALWSSQFGGDRQVIGKSIHSGVPHTVLGVMPASFQFPARSVEAWTSLTFSEEDFEDRTDTYLNVVARLRPGVPVESARLRRRARRGRGGGFGRSSSRASGSEHPADRRASVARSPRSGSPSRSFC
jgi:hypothetical protein